MSQSNPTIQSHQPSDSNVENVPCEADAHDSIPGSQKELFDPGIIRNYPRSNRKVSLEIAPYSLEGVHEQMSVQSLHISPQGVEFQSATSFAEGSLLKINISIPDYWARKQRFVEYRRIDAPNVFRILGKVVVSQDIGKRGKKKLITVQTVNIDEIDEQVLKSFLQDG